MDDLDAQLLSILQDGVPLVPRPWGTLANELGLGKTDVCLRIQALRTSGVIRRVGGVFDASRLGYRQTLLGFSVSAKELDTAAEIVSGHPGVSHCYGRDDEFNLWATLAVSPESKLGLERTVDILAKQAGAKAHLNLPATQRYKLAVRWGEVRSAKCGVRSAECEVRSAVSLSDEKRRAVRALQIDLPPHEKPYEEIARAADLPSAEALLVHAADFLAAGVLRRYAAVVNHVAAGAKANVMVVWRILPENARLAGATVAQCPAVSHDYLRATTPDWPYNLYTMIHGRSRDDCTAAIQSISQSLSQPDHRELWTKKEYKKAPVQLFTDDETAWENQHE